VQEFLALNLSRLLANRQLNSQVAFLLQQQTLLLDNNPQRLALELEIYLEEHPNSNRILQEHNQVYLDSLKIKINRLEDYSVNKLKILHQHLGVCLVQPKVQLRHSNLLSQIYSARLNSKIRKLMEYLRSSSHSVKDFSDKRQHNNKQEDYLITQIRPKAKSKDFR